MNFTHRSYEKELLDRYDLAFDDIRQNMKELDFINTYLGGHKITIDGLRRMIGKSNKDPAAELVICEIGCGGGDNLVAIDKWCEKKRIKARYVGIDINPHCIEVATRKLSSINVQLIFSDYKLADFKDCKPDLIFSSLFCHHFTDDELKTMLQWMNENAKRGFFINDLHRHPIAYYSIKLLTRLFSGSYLVKNDAPLSVLRGFKIKEWRNLLDSAGLTGHNVRWKWAFRHLITVKNVMRGMPLVQPDQIIYHTA